MSAAAKFVAVLSNSLKRRNRRILLTAWVGIGVTVTGT